LTNQKERWINPDTLPKELSRTKELMHQGNIKKASQIVGEFGKKNNLTDRELFFCKLLKANISYKRGRYTDAINYSDQIIKESQERGDIISLFDGLMIKAFCFVTVGEVNETENIIEQSEALLQRMKEELTIDLRERESFMVRIKANIYAWRGDIHQTLEYNQKALKLAEGSDDKELTSASLINIAIRHELVRDYKKAKVYAERAIEIGYQPFLGNAIGILIDILLSLNDIENAKSWLEKISELREKDDSKMHNTIYLYYKALLLKSSLRAKNRVKSEKLFKQVVDEMDISGRTVIFLGDKYILALINLCDLLLIELRMTNDLSIIEEINPYIEKLLEFSEQHRSYWVLAETHLLQAKLSLLTFDIKKAKRFLTQAKQIADRFKLTQISTKIANENNDLLEKLELWEKLKKSGASVAERFNLAQLEEQIGGMVQNRALLVSQIIETEVSIYRDKKICIVCRGEVLRFSYICNCGALYCRNCARTVIDLENVCWACEAPIDYTKPSKKFKYRTEKLKGQEKAKKK